MNRDNLIKLIEAGFTTYKGNLEVYESKKERSIYNKETDEVEYKWYLFNGK